MVLLWDYDKDELKKSEKGKILLLERQINYGPGKEKISLSGVKRYWSKLNLSPLRKMLMELLIWGKIQSSPESKKKFWI